MPARSGLRATACGYRPGGKHSLDSRRRASDPSGRTCIGTTLRLAATLESVARARQLVRSTLADWADNHVQTVVLLTSEVVTNAVVHGSPHQPGAELLVRLDCIDGRARVEVEDASTVPPTLGEGSLDAGSGRGMVLVDRLASGWGVTPKPPGKVVWFEVGP